MSIRIIFFYFALDDRRGHSLELYKSGFNLDTGKLAFSSKVCENWNCLPEHIVTSTSLKTGCILTTQPALSFRFAKLGVIY